ncbi:hypothetical protein K432DRAFT_413162 [Lepidopterella palustris CBS 459.81]|uniref:DUF952 domain-containing protein n=1 Tax=Lepidopterella palustris CBS 459.81 TaxID=1314670 RepID=A0A8E2ELG0_9PEZI|nr:hypothetical protein K432DRAFT_413162 [Lepidopterella palustris CBS 459.81]
MPPPTPLPSHVYKILPAAPPDPLPSVLPLSALDANDGYIHLSTAAQVVGTASRFFADANVLWLLKIPLQKLGQGGGQVKWEESGSGCFPHLYGADVGSEVVDKVVVVRRGEGEDWEGCFEGKLD